MKNNLIVISIICVFGFLSVSNVHLTKNEYNTDLNLQSLLKSAFAADCEESTGCYDSCTYTYANGDCCSVCCGDGKEADCGIWGCTCSL